MSRAIALALAGSAVAASLLLVLFGAACGIQTVGGTCSAEGCTSAVVECASSITPLAWGALGVSALALVGAWRDRPWPLASLGVVGAALAAWFGRPSPDPGLLVVAALVVASAAALRVRARHRVPAWRSAAPMLLAALLALAPLVAVPLLYASMPQSGWGKLIPPPVWAVALASFLPTALWVAFSCWRVVRPPSGEGGTGGLEAGPA